MLLLIGPPPAFRHTAVVDVRKDLPQERTNDWLESRTLPHPVAERYESRIRTTGGHEKNSERPKCERGNHDV